MHLLYESADKFVVMPKGHAVPEGLGSVDSMTTVAQPGAGSSTSGSTGTGATVSFKYDANHARSEKTLTRTDGSTERTVYVGKNFESVTDTQGGNVTRKRRIHLTVGGQQIGLYIKTQVNDELPEDSMRYLHTDALGNVDLITDHNGYEVARQQYLPFGERRQTISNLGQSDTHHGYRGYTGHEHLDDVGLIHMNARVMDPATGRFLSADSVVPDANVFLAHNRYAYVLNNPYKYTDPSGHVFDPVSAAIAGILITAITAQSDNPNIQLIGSIAGGALTGWASIAAGGVEFAMRASAANTAAAGGNKKAIIFSAVGAAAAYGIGHGGPNQTALFGNPGTYIAHGVTQGLIAKAQGGNFAVGFVSAVAGHASGGAGRGVFGSGMTPGAVVGRTAIAAVFGGITSDAMGGDARQGARTAVLVHLFNTEAGEVLKDHYLAYEARQEEKRISTLSDDELYAEAYIAGYRNDKSALNVDQ